MHCKLFLSNLSKNMLNKLTNTRVYDASKSFKNLRNFMSLKEVLNMVLHPYQDFYGKQTSLEPLRRSLR